MKALYQAGSKCRRKEKSCLFFEVLFSTILIPLCNLYMIFIYTYREKNILCIVLMPYLSTMYFCYQGKIGLFKEKNGKT